MWNPHRSRKFLLKIIEAINRGVLLDRQTKCSSSAAQKSVHLLRCRRQPATMGTWCTCSTETECACSTGNGIGRSRLSVRSKITSLCSGSSSPSNRWLRRWIPPGVRRYSPEKLLLFFTFGCVVDMFSVVFLIDSNWSFLSFFPDLFCDFVFVGAVLKKGILGCLSCRGKVVPSTASEPIHINWVSWRVLLGLRYLISLR